MLVKLSELKKYQLNTIDEQLAGYFDSILFDGGLFAVQFVAVELADLKPVRTVLLSPAVLGLPDMLYGKIRVLVPKAHILKSPGLETISPVSMQHRQALAKHYGWPAFWKGTTVDVPGVMTPPRLLDDSPDDKDEREIISENPLDFPLWRTSNIKGFRVMAKDGQAGQVSDFVIDSKHWKIAYFEVKTGLFGAHKIIVRPESVETISWDNSAIYVPVYKNALQKAAKENQFNNMDQI